MKKPTWRPWRSGSPQKTGSFAPSTMSFEIGTNSWRVVLERPAEAEQEHADPDRDPVEHDRRDHLVGADGRLQEAGDARPRARRRARPRRPRGGCAGPSSCPANDEPIQTAKHRADDVLALAADVEQAAAERERDREAGEDQRRREDQRLLQVERRERRARAPVTQGKNQLSPAPSKIARYVVSGFLPVVDEHDEAADEEREERRSGPARAGRRPSARRRSARASDCRTSGPRPDGSAGRAASSSVAHAAASCPRPPPVIAMPSSSSVAAGGNSPTISPS